MEFPADWIVLRTDALTAAIDPQGAQLSVLRDAQGRDLLWDGNPAYWNGRAPVLFPIVGALNQGAYQLGDARYALPRHGFARGRRFEVVQQDARSVLLRQGDDEATRAVYPFAFQLDMAFTVDAASLECVGTVRNLGTVPLYASLGFHPAFRWPLPGGAARAAHRIEFDCDEPAPVRRLDSAGLVKPAAEPTPVTGRTLLLDDALFGPDVLIFDQLHSRRLRYGAPGAPGIEIRFTDAQYLGLWSKPGAGFVCIEPWRGVADPAGYAGAFADKPGVVALPRQHDSFSLGMTLQLTT